MAESEDELSEHCKIYISDMEVKDLKMNTGKAKV